MEECPKCKNKKITRLDEVMVLKEYSVQTGKLLKNHGQTGTNCWNYKCRCGWLSEIFTE